MRGHVVKALCSLQGMVSFHPSVILFSVCPADTESLGLLAPRLPLQPGLTLSEGPGQLATRPGESGGGVRLPPGTCAYLGLLAFLYLDGIQGWLPA